MNPREARPGVSPALTAQTLPCRALPTFPSAQPAPVLPSGLSWLISRGSGRSKGGTPLDQDPALLRARSSCTDPGNCPRPRQCCKGDTPQGHGDRGALAPEIQVPAAWLPFCCFFSTKTHPTSLLALTHIPSPPKSCCPLTWSLDTRFA